ncbi:MAG: EamA family transporter [Oligoflexia bacterium]|nr:EamA family transporter [Oligoflexia bacterium]
MKANSSTLPILALCIVATSFAGTGCLTREFGISFAPPAWLLTQATAGCLCLLPTLRLESVPRLDIGILLARGALGWCLGGYFFFEAVQHGSLANAAALSALPWGGAWSVFVWREKANLSLFLGLLLASLGVLLLTGGSFTFDYAAMCAILSGLFISLAQILRPLHASNLRDTQLACLGNAISAALLLLWVQSKGLIAEWLLAINNLGWKIGLILVFQQGMNAFLLNYAFGRIAPSLGSIVLTLEVLIGMSFGAMIYHEQLLAAQLLGGLLIMSSVVLSSIRNPSPQTHLD